MQNGECKSENEDQKLLCLQCVVLVSLSAGLLTSLTVLLLIVGEEIIQGVLWCLSVLLLLLRLTLTVRTQVTFSRERVSVMSDL